MKHYKRHGWVWVPLEIGGTINGLLKPKARVLPAQSTNTIPRKTRKRILRHVRRQLAANILSTKLTRTLRNIKVIRARITIRNPFQ